MRKTCPYILQDVPTDNGRIYSKAMLESIVEQANNPRGSEQYVAHDFSGSWMVLSDVAGQVSNCALENGRLACDVELLDTPRGKILKKIDESLLVLSPVATAFLNDNGEIGYIRLRGWTLKPEQK